MRFLQKFCSRPSSAPSLQLPVPQPSSASQHRGSGQGYDKGRRGAQGAAEELRGFCREALYECITQEKPGSLQSYLLLYSLMQAVLGNDRGQSMLWQHWPSRMHCSHIMLLIITLQTSSSLQGDLLLCHAMPCCAVLCCDLSTLKNKVPSQLQVLSAKCRSTPVCLHRVAEGYSPGSRASPHSCPMESETDPCLLQQQLG